MTRLILIALIVPRLAGAQALQPLGASRDEHPFALSSVTQMRELRDGRVIVVDSRERSVRLLDFATRTERRIGREGAGPLEIQQPTHLLALPNDTTAIWDGQLARLLFIAPDATPIRTDRLLTDNGRPVAVEASAPRQADAAGRIYFEGTTRPDGSGRDSIPVLRLDRRTARVDTVGSILHTPGTPALMGPPERQFTISIAHPFSPRQEWVATADGRVGVVRSPDYRLDWVSPTARRGSEVAYPRIAVTEADKLDWRESQRSMVLTRAQDSRGGGPAPRSIPEPTTWPEFKPPFLGSAVRVDPAGRVWVQRAGALSDTLTTYDVFDAEARLVRRVSLPRSHRVVGFGRDVVYTTRADGDDLLRLNRHPMPR